MKNRQQKNLLKKHKKTQFNMIGKQYKAEIETNYFPNRQSIEEMAASQLIQQSQNIETADQGLQIRNYINRKSQTSLKIIKNKTQSLISRQILDFGHSIKPSSKSKQSTDKFKNRKIQLNNFRRHSLANSSAFPSLKNHSINQVNEKQPLKPSQYIIIDKRPAQNRSKKQAPIKSYQSKYQRALEELYLKRMKLKRKSSKQIRNLSLSNRQRLQI